MTKVTHVPTAIEIEDDDENSCSSPVNDIKCSASSLSIDDVSKQIAKAKEMAFKISLGDKEPCFSNSSLFSHIENLNKSHSTVGGEEHGFLTPISENLTPLPPDAFEFMLRVHRWVSVC